MLSIAAGLLTTLSSLLLARVYSTPLLAARQSYTGDGTYYQPALGACGVTNTPDQLIVAVGHGVFDSYPGANAANPNENPICGKQIKATYQGKSVTVTVEDRCAGCAGAADLDFTQAGFSQLASTGTGRISGVTWEFV